MDTVNFAEKNENRALFIVSWKLERTIIQYKKLLSQTLAEKIEISATNDHE